MMLRRINAVAVAISMSCAAVRAAEPNEDFDRATILPPGIAFVEDSLNANGPNPDTLLGVRHFHDVLFIDDDQSMYGDGLASGLQHLPAPTARDSIDFMVSGTGDDSFDGNHSEFGRYKVFIDVFDSSGEPLGSEIRTGFLTPELVDDYSVPVSADFDGTYNINIDNTTGANDVDFFTFTAASAGAPFVVTISDPGPMLDPLLGWYSSAGALLETDDTSGGTPAMIAGIVPASGTLTFAVTGAGDVSFTGNHGEEGTYGLGLIVDTGVAPGDYNGNGVVDSADYTTWRDTLGSTTILDADGDGDQQVGPGDYIVWKQNFGQTSGAGAKTDAVPEPGCLAVLPISIICLQLFRLRS